MASGAGPGEGARACHCDLPGLGIRTELKGVCLSLFGLNLAVFIFLFSVWTMWFWSILAEKSCVGRIWPRKVVLVNFGR